MRSLTPARSATARIVTAFQSRIDDRRTSSAPAVDDALSGLPRRARAAGRCRSAARTSPGLAVTSTTGSVSHPLHRRRRGELGAVEVDLPFREAAEDLVERDAAFEARERGAEAEVDPVPEGQVLADLAVDVEPFRVGPTPLVAVRGGDDEQHRAPRRDDGAVPLDVLRDVPAHLHAGGLVAQQLLDGVRDERPVGDELTPLVGVLAQHLAGPAYEAGRRLVAGAGDDRRVEHRLVARQAPGGAGLVLELRVQQLRHEVVGRVLDPPVDVVGEHLAAERRCLADLHRLPVLGAQVRVGAATDRLLVGLGDAEQHADHPHRHLGAEVGDEVERAGPDERVEAAGAELADLRFERGRRAAA